MRINSGFAMILDSVPGAFSGIAPKRGLTARQPFAVSSSPAHRKGSAVKFQKLPKASWVPKVTRRMRTLAKVSMKTLTLVRTSVIATSISFATTS